MAPTGALKASLMSNFKAPLPSYITEEERQRVTDLLLGGGMEGPLCWYKVITSGLSGEDDKGKFQVVILGEHAPDSCLSTAIPHAQSYPPASSPLFYGAAAHDAVALAASGKNLFTGEPFKNHNVTIQDYDADHWVILSHANKVNQHLEAWLDNVVIPVCKARL